MKKTIKTKTTMRNKQLFVAAMTLLMVCSGCSEHVVSVDEAPVYHPISANWQDSLATYRDQALQGSGDAYLKLATCYHEGRGVPHDYLMAYSMVQMAEQYGGVENWMDFFNAMPADDPDRLLMEAINDIDNQQPDEALRKAELLAAKGHSEADFVRGAVALDEGRKEEALTHFTLAAEKGDPLAQLAISVIKEKKQAKLTFADRMPLFYCDLARECFHSDFDPAEDEQAANFYRMADSLLCLDRHGVHWLLGYYEHQSNHGHPSADSLTIARLRTLSTKLVPRKS